MTTEAMVLQELDYGRKVRQRRAALTSVIYHVLMGGFGILMMYPIIWLFASSFKGPDDIWTNVTSLIPKQIVFENYTNGWKGFGGITFATFFKNSFIFSVFATVFAVFSSAFIAYTFGRIRFWGRDFWFGCMLLTLMLPNQVLLIPQYLMFSKLGWVNTFLPLLVPRMFGMPFFIFLMVQFIRGIPTSLDEAAEIDGCTPMGIFFRIMLPLLQPVLITASIFSFYWTWSEFLGPLLYLNEPKLYTISIALRSFADPQSVTDWGAIFAMLSLSLVPVFFIFVLFQKYIVEGISTSGIKS